MTEAFLTETERHAVSKTLYTAIHTGQIRLLRLHAGEADQPLVLDLSRLQLTDTSPEYLPSSPGVKYEALSYTWGEPIFARPVQINGQTFAVTENLFTALRHLRSRSAERTLWIDALCINQYDAVEKSEQVRQMYEIFRRATVIVWLGGEGPDTRACCDFLAANNDFLDQIHMFYENSDGEEEYRDDRVLHDQLPSWVLVERMRRVVTLIEQLGVDERLAVSRGAIDLIRRPWMSRAWIIQEAKAGDLWDLPVHIGSVTIRFRHFLCLSDCYLALLEVAEEFQEDPSVSISIEELWRQTQPLKYLRNLLSEGPIDDDFQIMSDTTHVRCTDSRDRIYAIPGVGCQDDRGQVFDGTFVPVDYTGSLEQVFTRLALSMMNRRQMLSVLFDVHTDDLGVDRWNECHCQAVHKALPPLSLPSWVPDWRCFRSTNLDRLALWKMRSVPGWTTQTANPLKLRGLKIADVLENVSMANATKDGKDIAVARCTYEPAVRDALSTLGCKVEMEKREVLETTRMIADGDDQPGLDEVEVLAIEFAGRRTIVEWQVKMAQPGDELVTLVGSLSLVVLRPRPNGGHSFVECSWSVQWGEQDDGLQVDEDFFRRLEGLRCSELAHANTDFEIW